MVIDNSSASDQEILKPETGIRALWLLYKRGQWGRLEDFGVDRKATEPQLKRFEAENVVEGRLTKSQVRSLTKSVPGLVEAGREMRLAYALKFLDTKKVKEILNGS